MTVPSPSPSSPTALDRLVAEAHETAKAVAEKWARAPLNAQAQASALTYLTEIAPGDQELAECWAADPGLPQRIAALVEGASAALDGA